MFFDLDDVYDFEVFAVPAGESLAGLPVGAARGKWAEVVADLVDEAIAKGQGKLTATGALEAGRTRCRLKCSLVDCRFVCSPRRRARPGAE